MTEISRPFDGTSIGDAGPYSAADWQDTWKALFHGTSANAGVIIDSGTGINVGLLVQATNPNTTSIEVLPGAALVQGIAYLSDATETFAIAANASGNPRIDTVILRADYPAQTVRLAVLQGTAAATPVPPTLTQSAGILWEIPIADIAVANGFVTLTDADITPRAEWANAPDGVYLLNVLNNSGVTLEHGDVVIWDSSADRAVTRTTTPNDRLIAGVWQGRAANGAYGRVQVSGIGLVSTAAAVTRGLRLGTAATAGTAQNTPFTGYMGRALETTSGAGLALTQIDCNVNYVPVAVIEDQKAQNTDGGTSTGGAWSTRVLNTEVSDPDGIVSITSNQFRPIAGVYKAQAVAPFISGASTSTLRIRIINADTAVVVATGLNAFVPGGSNGGIGHVMTPRFTANGTDDYEVQYYILSGRATNGLGAAMNVTGEVERYTQLILEKVG